MNIKNKLVSMRKRANQKNMLLDIDYLWLENKLKLTKCELSGIEFVYFPIMNPFYPVIDRIDSNKGYTKNNCIVIVNLLNYAKGELCLDTLQFWAIKFINKYEENLL